MLTNCFRPQLFDGKQRSDYEKRAAALSELKRNMDAAAANIQGQNALRSKRSKVPKSLMEGFSGSYLFVCSTPDEIQD